MRKRGREKQKRKKTGLKRLSGALFWSFKGQHGKKMFRCGGVPDVTGTLGRPTAVLTSPKRDRRENQHVEAAVYWCRLRK